jgi:hypothetical protein
MTPIEIDVAHLPMDRERLVQRPSRSPPRPMPPA